MRHITFVLTAVTMLGWSTPAAAQVESGRHEVGVRGSFDRANYDIEPRYTTIEFDGSYGHFITNRFEIGPTFTFSKLGQQDAAWGISGYVSVHLGDTSSHAVPYISTAYGQSFGPNHSGVDPTFAAVGPGLKWFFGDGGGALDFSAFYRRTFLDIDTPPNFASGVDEFGAKVGVAIFFGR